MNEERNRVITHLSCYDKPIIPPKHPRGDIFRAYAGADAEDCDDEEEPCDDLDKLALVVLRIGHINHLSDRKEGRLGPLYLPRGPQETEGFTISAKVSRYNGLARLRTWP